MARVRKGWVRAEPNLVDFGDAILNGDPLPMKTVLLAANRQVRQMTPIVDPAALVASIEASAGKPSEFQLKLTPVPSLVRGFFSSSVRVQATFADGTKAEVVPLTASGVMHLPVEAVPDPLPLGVIPVGHTVTQIVTVRSLRKRSINIERVEMPSKGATATRLSLASSAHENKYQLAVTANKEGSQSLTVRFLVKEAGSQSAVSIPVVVSYYSGNLHLHNRRGVSSVFGQFSANQAIAGVIFRPTGSDIGKISGKRQGVELVEAFKERRLAYIVALFALLLLPRGLDGGDMELAKVLGDWQARQRIAIAAEYKVKGTRTDLAGRFGESPKEDHSGTMKIRWLFNFGHNWLRKEMSQEMFFDSLNVYAPTFKVEAYDGQQMALYEPREKNTSSYYTPIEGQPDLYRQSKDYMTSVLGFLDDPILLAHGLVTSNRVRPTPNHLIVNLNAADFAVYGKSNSGGIDCVIVRTRPDRYGSQGEYWVDPARSSAIVRYTRFRKDQPFAKFDIDYQETKSGWLPSHWVYTDYFFDASNKGKVATIYELSVASITIKS